MKYVETENERCSQALLPYSALIANDKQKNQRCCLLNRMLLTKKCVHIAEHVYTSDVAVSVVKVW